MEHTYNYRVLKVDDINNCMEVVYEMDGRGVHHIGVRLPFAEESLESVIQSAAPIWHWEAEGKQRAQVSEGAAGSLAFLSAEVRSTSLADVAVSVRIERNARLEATDWTQLVDAPLSVDAKQQWKEYRQALRDMTSAAGFPETVSWPEAPGAFKVSVL